jgi:hypothetical protein
MNDRLSNLRPPFDSESGRAAQARRKTHGPPKDECRALCRQIAFGDDRQSAIQLLREKLPKMNAAALVRAIDVLCRYGLGTQGQLELAERQQIPSLKECAQRLADAGIPEDRWPPRLRGLLD